MEVRRWVSWCALTSSWTSRGMAPCSRSGAWFAGQSARLRINPTVACSSERRWGIRERKGCVCYLALCLFVIKSVGPKQLDLDKRQLESCSFEAAFPSDKLCSPTPQKHSIFLSQCYIKKALVFSTDRHQPLFIYLDQRPVWGWVQQFNHHWQSIMETYCILSHFSFLMSAGEVTERTNSRFCDVLPVPSSKNCAHKSLDATNLADHHLVLVIVASKIRKDSSSTSHNINIIWS